MIQNNVRYEDGGLYWIKSGKRRVVGERAGCLRPDGYRTITCDGVAYKEHRLIWEMFNGPIPEGYEIDHINRDRSDNRIENLRLVTRQQNAFNRGAIGAHRRPNGKWESRICIDDKRLYLGLFDSKEESHQAYLQAKEIYHNNEKEQK